MYTASARNKIGRKMPPPIANGTLCLSTPKHNGKSGTGWNTPFLFKMPAPNQKCDT